MFHTCQFDQLKHCLDVELQKNDLLLLSESIDLGFLSDPDASVEQDDELLITVELV
jgi:hypothetical protein